MEIVRGVPVAGDRVYLVLKVPFPCLTGHNK